MDLIIVDDEMPARQALRDLIAQIPGCTVRADVATVAAARKIIDDVRPDGIFLDIGLSDGDGFDVIRGGDRTGNIIFVTADATRAVEAFAEDAVDYLLKPIDLPRLRQAIDRLRRRREQGHVGPRSPADATTILVKEGARTQPVAVDAIVSVTGEDDYSRIVVRDGRSFLTARRITDWEDELPSRLFVRLTRSLLINRAGVVQVTYRSRDETVLVLNGHDAPLVLGRTGTARLRQLMRDNPA